MKRRNTSWGFWAVGGLVLTMLVAAGHAQQVPALDLNFKPVLTKPGGSVSAVAVQADGKLLVAGGFNAVQGEAHNGLVRLSPDGTLDPTFQTGAICCGVGSGNAGLTAPVTALAIQADGKILVGGYFATVGDVSRPGLARLNANGSLDTTFDPGTGLSLGSAALSFPPVVKFLVQPDGKILVGGYFSTVNGVSRRGIVRLNANGGVDTTFDPGTALAIGDPVDVSRLTDMALLSSGQILVAGNFQSFNAVPRTGLARLNANGSLDTKFVPDLGQQNATPGVDSMVLLSDGSMVVGGTFDIVDGIPMAGSLARLTSESRYDPSFNANVDSTHGESYLLLGLQSPGDKMIAYHQFTDLEGQEHRELARLNSDGTLDTTFTIPILPRQGGSGPEILDLLFQTDGKFILVGNYAADTTGLHEGIVRFDATGVLDSSLTPRLETSEGASPIVLAVASQEDNRVLVGGSFTLLNGVQHPELARFNSDGTIDTTFTPRLSTNDARSAVTALFVQKENQKILVAGTFSSINETNRNGFAQLNPDGSLDDTFDPGSGTGGTGRIISIAQQADGKILVAGDFSELSGVPVPWAGRFETNGSLDMTFHVDFPTCPSCNAPVLRNIGVLTNGVVMLSGAFDRIEAFTVHGLARLNPDGSADLAFTPPITADEQVDAMVVSPDDKTTVAIRFPDSAGGPSHTRFLRFTDKGTVDSSFTSTEVIGEGTAASPVATMTLDAAGRYLIAGAFTSVGGVSRHGLARLNPDGTLDATFGDISGFRSGVIRPQASQGLVTSITVQTNGGVVVGGSFAAVGPEVRLGVARFQADAAVPGDGGNGGGTGGHIQSPARTASGEFTMMVLGTTGKNYRVEASSDLRAWTKVGTITGAAAPQPFTDSEAKIMARRFYRVMAE